jgi:hypothetical protein
MSDYQIEPELLQPVPRRVRMDNSSGALGCLAGLWLFLTPFILIGVFMPLWAVHKTVVEVLGHDVPGRVQERVRSHQRHGYEWYLRYTYTAGGEEHVAKDKEPDSGAYPEGGPILVRVSPILPGIDSRIVAPGAAGPSELAFVWLFAIFWNAILSIFVYMLIVVPILSYQIYRRGEVGVATIVDLTTKTSRDSQGRTDTSYVLTYEYTPVGPDGMAGALVRDTQNASQREWDKEQIGDDVTVLYWKRPLRLGPWGRIGRMNSVLYRYGGFRVVPRIGRDHPINPSTGGLG